MIAKWLRKLIGCCADHAENRPIGIVSHVQLKPGRVVFLDDQQIAELEEKERLERLFQE